MLCTIRLRGRQNPLKRTVNTAARVHALTDKLEYSSLPPLKVTVLVYCSGVRRRKVDYNGSVSCVIQLYHIFCVWTWV